MFIKANEYTRSYKTFDNAVVAAQQITAKFGVDAAHDNRVVITIAATNDGRYSPVFYLRQGVLHLSVALAARGFHTVG